MRLKFLLLNLITVIILSGSLFPFRANAISSSDILVNVAPENPAPGENVSITLNSYAFNLDSVLISWSIGGKTLLSGIGKKSFSLKAPGAGGETTVVAMLSLPEGKIDTRIVVRPNVIVLLWQTDDSYVPPFYRGKAMPSPASQIKVVALPEIKSGAQMLSPKNMVYAWKKDYTNNQDGSGYGKSSFIYTSDYLEDSNNISVKASTVDQKYSSEASINIGTIQPKILFYKNDANLGTLWEQSLQNGHKIKDAEIIEATPYFISPKDIRIPILDWSWSINNNPVEVLGARKNLLPLKTEAGVSGTSLIKLEIENVYKLFESASKEISVEF